MLTAPCVNISPNCWLSSCPFCLRMLEAKIHLLRHSLRFKLWRRIVCIWQPLSTLCWDLSLSDVAFSSRSLVDLSSFLVPPGRFSGPESDSLPPDRTASLCSPVTLQVCFVWALPSLASVYMVTSLWIRQPRNVQSSILELSFSYKLTRAFLWDQNIFSVITDSL